MDRRQKRLYFLLQGNLNLYQLVHSLLDLTFQLQSLHLHTPETTSSQDQTPIFLPSHPLDLLLHPSNLQSLNILVCLYFSLNTAYLVRQTTLEFVLYLSISAETINLLITTYHLQGQLFPLPLFLSLLTSEKLYLFHGYFMVKDAGNFGKVSVPVDQPSVSFFPLLQFPFKSIDLHFHANNLIVLITKNGVENIMIDLWFREVQVRTICKVPSLDLMFHSSILFFYIPDPSPNGIIFLLGLVDEAFQLVVLVPDDILGSIGAVEVDIGVEDIMVGVYLSAEMILRTYSFVKSFLACLKGLVIFAQDKERRVIDCFHIFYYKLLPKPNHKQIYLLRTSSGCSVQFLSPIDDLQIKHLNLKNKYYTTYANQVEKPKFIFQPFCFARTFCFSVFFEISP